MIRMFKYIVFSLLYCCTAQSLDVTAAFINSSGIRPAAGLTLKKSLKICSFPREFSQRELPGNNKTLLKISFSLIFVIFHLVKDMKAYSTGHLSKEQLQEQERLYHLGLKYDYLFIGSGVSALTAAALYAHAGYSVCLLEAHDVPGGYAHTFEMNDFHFCAQVHYIWGCAPGQRIYEFLKKIGLEKEIEFQSYNPKCYDVISLPDGKRVGIPYGYEKLIDNVEAAYPGQGQGVKNFIGVIRKISQELAQFPSEPPKWWEYLTKAHRFFNLIRYRNKTLQNVLDECGVQKEAQAILSGNSGDFMCPPEELSIFAFIGLFNGYNEGAYYPTKHFKHFTERLARFIQEHKNCHIFYETEVSKINIENNKVTSVETKDGKRFQSNTCVCNMDPQKASRMIGQEKFPKDFQKPLAYRYSPSSFNIYLGVKDIDLRDYGMGNFNIWHVGDWDANAMWKKMMANNYDNPLIFMSTPTLHTKTGGLTPDNSQILEVVTSASYDHFKNIRAQDEALYRKEKRKLENQLLDIVEEKYVPGLRKHISLKVVGTPMTNESFCYAPYGNCYGSHMLPENMTQRLSADTPWDNFFWCNASSGYASVFGAVYTGTELYMKLSKDRFFETEKAPSTEKAIAYATSLSKEIRAEELQSV